MLATSAGVLIQERTRAALVSPNDSMPDQADIDLLLNALEELVIVFPSTGEQVYRYWCFDTGGLWTTCVVAVYRDRLQKVGVM